MQSDDELVGDGPVRGIDIRGGVARRLRARRSELVEAIFARVSGGAFGAVGAMDAEYVAGLRGAVVAAVEHGLEGIERGEGWVGAIPVAVGEQARRAVRVGVSLETVLRRYVVGHTLMGEFVLEEIERGERDGIPPTQRGALRDALRAQASVLDRLLEAITSEYEDELVRVGRSPERRRLELVRGLLAGERMGGGGGGGGGDAGAGELGDELGYELAGEHVGVIARGAGARELLRGVAGRLDRRLLCVGCDEVTVWAWLGGRRRMEMATLERALGELERAHPAAIADPPGAEGANVAPAGDAPSTDVAFAVGEPARGYEGWRLSHQQAQAALVVAMRRYESRPGVGGVTGGVTRYADVALLASALKDEMLGRALVERYIAPLEDARGGGPVLCETLRAYLAAECNVSSAAIKLGVARSTVKDRRRTIEERLGRTLRRCSPELEVALLLDELAPASHPPDISITGKGVT
jgi:hypothetical protein